MRLLADPQVRDTLREMDRRASERWAEELRRAAETVHQPARALSPATAARVRAKLRARAVGNRPVCALHARWRLDELD